MLKELNPLEDVKFTAESKIPQLQDTMSAIIKRCNDLLERPFVDKDELEPLKEQLGTVAGELGHVKSKVDGYATTLEAFEKKGPEQSLGEFGLSKRQLTKLKPPERMSAAHFNIVSHTPEELSYAGHMKSAALIYGVSRSGQAAGRKYGMSDEWRGLISEYHALNDLVLLLDTIKGAKVGPQYYAQQPKDRFASFAIFQDYMAVSKVVRDRTNVAMKAANTGLDTETPGEGLEWIPTVFSGELIQRIRAALVITNLFRHIAMPSETYKIPALVADGIGYKMAQALEEGADKVRARTFVTDAITMVAQKIGARMLASGEVEEDSIIPIAPLMIDQLILAIGRAWEQATIDGDITALHQDADVVLTDDARRLWPGLRKLALTAGNTVDFANGDIGFRAMMGMGKLQERYGRPSQNVIITGYSGFVELALAKDDNNNNIFLTRKDYGDAAVVVEGEIGQVGGTPILLSDFIRQDLNAAGVYDGVTTDRTIAIRVNRETMLVGDRRDVTLRASNIPYMESDQTVAVATYRGDVKPLYKQPDEAIVAMGINIRS